MPKKKRSKRGFLIALLIGFDEQAIHLWYVYSHSIRSYKQFKLHRKWKYSDDKQKYSYYEDLVNLIRPIVNQGLKSILLTNPPKKNYADGFLNHVRKHHQWLVRPRGDNQVSFGQLVGHARSWKEANYLIGKEESLEILSDTTLDEAVLIIKQLEKSVSANDKKIMILYDLKGIEEVIYEHGKKDKTIAEKLDYLILTNNYLDNHKNKNRIQRLLQIAKNKGIKTKIFSEESSSGERVNQFGGIISFKKK